MSSCCPPAVEEFGSVMWRVRQWIAHDMGIHICGRFGPDRSSSSLRQHAPCNRSICGRANAHVAAPSCPPLIAYNISGSYSASRKVVFDFSVSAHLGFRLLLETPLSPFLSPADSFSFCNNKCRMRAVLYTVMEDNRQNKSSGCNNGVRQQYLPSPSSCYSTRTLLWSQQNTFTPAAGCTLLLHVYFLCLQPNAPDIQS